MNINNIMSVIEKVSKEGIQSLDIKDQDTYEAIQQLVDVSVQVENVVWNGGKSNG